MRIEIAAYMAGLIDGEGSISLQRYSSTANRIPYVSVSSTTLALVEFAKESCGGTIHKKGVPQKQHWKQGYEWRIIHDAALRLLADILPYLREPEKVRRAQLLVTRYKLVVPRNGRYTEETKRKRREFEEDFFVHSAQAQRIRW